MKKIYIFLIRYDCQRAPGIIMRTSLKDIRKEHVYYRNMYKCGPINKLYIDAGVAK